MKDELSRSNVFPNVSGALKAKAATTSGSGGEPLPEPPTPVVCIHARASARLVLDLPRRGVIAEKVCDDCGSVICELGFEPYALPTLKSPLPPERLAA